MQDPLLYKLVMSKNRKQLVNYFERNFNFGVCLEEKSTNELIWLWISESLDSRLPSTKPFSLRSKNIQGNGYGNADFIPAKNLQTGI